MRRAPTSALWSAAVVVALALAGCAADDGEPEEPTTAPETNETTAGSQKEHAADAPKTKTGDRPDFAPQFDTSKPPADKDDAKKQPTASTTPDRCTDDDDAASTPALAKKLPETDDCN